MKEYKVVSLSLPQRLANFLSSIPKGDRSQFVRKVLNEAKMRQEVLSKIKDDPKSYIDRISNNADIDASIEEIEELIKEGRK